MPSPSAGLEADRALVGEAAREAGRLAMRFMRRGLRVWDKAPGDPVSEADLAADTLLKEVLGKARPDYGWLSEETADDRARLEARRTFVVDPIDGTRAFVKGRAEFVVSVAVVEAGRPVAAAIYNPSNGALYDAAEGHGAALNGEPIQVTAADAISGARILGDPGRLTALRDIGAQAFTVNSAALRLALLAEGAFDAVVAVRGKWDWDLAAGHLILEEAGGRMTGSGGQALSYAGEQTRQPPPLAAGPALHALLLDHLNQSEA